MWCKYIIYSIWDILILKIGAIGEADKKSEVKKRQRKSWCPSWYKEPEIVKYAKNTKYINVPHLWDFYDVFCSSLSFSISPWYWLSPDVPSIKCQGEWTYNTVGFTITSSSGQVALIVIMVWGRRMWFKEKNRFDVQVQRAWFHICQRCSFPTRDPSRHLPHTQPWLPALRLPYSC